MSCCSLNQENWKKDWEKKKENLLKFQAVHQIIENYYCGSHFDHYDLILQLSQKISQMPFPSYFDPDPSRIPSIIKKHWSILTFWLSFVGLLFGQVGLCTWSQSTRLGQTVCCKSWQVFFVQILKCICSNCCKNFKMFFVQVKCVRAPWANQEDWGKLSSREIKSKGVGNHPS